MGPRLGSRGKSSTVAEAFAATSTLQWGRDLEVAERGDFGRLPIDVKRLQWGRDLEVAESRRWLESAILLAGLASMGPRLGSRGKSVQDLHATGSERASMGPRLGSRGK